MEVEKRSWQRQSSARWDISSLQLLRHSSRRVLTSLRSLPLFLSPFVRGYETQLPQLTPLNIFSFSRNKQPERRDALHLIDTPDLDFRLRLDLSFNHNPPSHPPSSAQSTSVCHQNNPLTTPTGQLHLHSHLNNLSWNQRERSTRRPKAFAVRSSEESLQMKTKCHAIKH